MKWERTEICIKYNRSHSPKAKQRPLLTIGSENDLAPAECQAIF